MEPKVFNKRGPVPEGAVYVGRPTKFGNPFAISAECERDAVCEVFEAYVLSNPALVASIKGELRGKNLVCWCAPLRCHADTLLRIANE